MPKIKVYVNTGFAGCTHKDIWDYDDDEWNDLTEEEKQQELNQYAMDFMNTLIECGAHVVEDE